MHYTGIGSRETPFKYQRLMTQFAEKMAEKGWTLRSGGAKGADTAFAAGATKKEIYIPWNGFNGLSHDPENGIILCSKEAFAKAEKIVSGIHPAWDKVSRGARTLHSRNMFQVTGANLDKPSRFVICYAPVDKYYLPKGGTRSAFVYGQRCLSLCLNMAIEEDYDRIRYFLK